MVSRAVVGVACGNESKVSCSRDSIDCDLVCSVDWIGKVRGPEMCPASMRKKLTDSRAGALLHHHACKVINAVDNFWPLAQHGLQLFQTRVKDGGVFEVESGRSGVTLRRDFPHQRFPFSIEITLHARYFGAVFLVAATLETRRETHFHFRIDATGELGIGMQIVDAAAHLEEIERVTGELFGHAARSERPIVNVPAAQTPKPRSDRSPGKFVIQVKLDQRSEA